MENKHTLFGTCGSFCNHAAVLEQLTALYKHNDVTTVVSGNVCACSTRFFDKGVFMGKAENVTKHDITHTIVEAERVGPVNTYDIVVIAPMTAAVIAKMTHGIYDHPVTLSVKAMIRNQRNIVLGTATDDGLGIGEVNIFSLIDMKHFYIIPFRQGTPFSRERNIASNQELMEQMTDQILDDRQLQPILLGDR